MEDNTIEIIRAEAFALELNFSSESETEAATLYTLSARLLTPSGSTLWTKSEGLGITRLTGGWYLTLTSTDTDHAPGNYLMAFELKTASSGVPFQTVTAVRIQKDLIAQ